MIRFYCQCGKPLKARDESAGRRTKCPQCGEPVGIPSLTPTHRGVEPSAETATANASLQSRASVVDSARDRQVANDSTTYGLQGRSSVPQLSAIKVGAAKRTKTKKQRRGASSSASIEIRQRSQPRWLRLVGPRDRLSGATVIGASEPVFSVFWFTAISMFAAAVAIAQLPFALQEGWIPWPHGPVVIVACLVLVVCAGYYSSCAGNLLNSAMRGKKHDFSHRVRLEDALVNFGLWLLYFLAGPILPTGLAIDYWMQHGASTPADWVVLTGLTAVAVGYWFAQLISVTANRNIRSVAPHQVFAVYQRLGLTGVSATFLAVALLFAALLGVTFAAALIHADNTGGYALLGLCCLAGPLSLLAILHRLGAEHRRSAARQSDMTVSVANASVLAAR